MNLERIFILSDMSALEVGKYGNGKNFLKTKEGTGICRIQTESLHKLETLFWKNHFLSFNPSLKASPTRSVTL